MPFFLTVEQLWERQKKIPEVVQQAWTPCRKLTVPFMWIAKNSQGEVFSLESDYLDQKGNLHLGTSKPNYSYQAFPTVRRRDFSFIDSFLFGNFLCPPEFLQNDKQNGFTKEQLKQTQLQPLEQQCTDEVTQQWSVAVHWYRHQTPTHSPWENKERMARTKNKDERKGQTSRK